MSQTLARQTQSAVDTPSTPRPSDPDAGDILIVDDTASSLQALSHLLTQKGYTVRCASDGPTALMLARTDPPELILLDIMIPGMSGYQVCQALKAQDSTRHIPIIFISALDEVFDKVKGFQLGGADYITKPFQAEEVLARIKAHITLHRTQAEAQRQRQIAESLREVATILNSSLDRQKVLKAIFEQLQRVVHYDGAGILLLDDDELVLAEAVGITSPYLGQHIPLVGDAPPALVIQNRQVQIIDDVAEHPRWFAWLESSVTRSWMGAPLVAGQAIIGLLSVDSRQKNAYRDEDGLILQVFANQAALAIENARLYEQAQTVAVDAERQRLARELHDSATQSIYSLTLLTSGWGTMARQGRLNMNQVADHFKQLEEISLQALKEMRLLIHQLRPPILEEVGLVGALQQRLDAVEHRVNVETRLYTSGPVDSLPRQIEEHLFFIAQEALNNALRHAKATAITVRLKVEAEHISLTIQDNGTGFEPSSPSSGMGLVNMQERAESIGGQMQIISSPHQGTTIQVTIGLKEEQG